MEQEINYYGYLVDLKMKLPIEFQKQHVEEWAKKNGKRITKWRTEDFSKIKDSSPWNERPVFKAMLEIMMDENDILVVYDFSILGIHSYIHDKFVSMLTEKKLNIISVLQDVDITNYQPTSFLDSKNKTSWLDMPVELTRKVNNFCCGYVRVSTESQAEEGISLQEQEYLIKEKAEKLGLTLVKIYKDEGLSGTEGTERPGLNQMIKEMNEGQTLISYSVSRISRSFLGFMNLVNDLTKRGIRMILLANNLDTEDKFIQLQLIFQSYFAQEEARVIKERTKMAMDAKKRNEEHVGRVPYGWKLKGGKGCGLLEDEDQQQIIQFIKYSHDEENLTFTEIASILDQKKVPTPGRSANWSVATVSTIYKRKPESVATKGRKNNNSDSKG